MDKEKTSESLESHLPGVLSHELRPALLFGIDYGSDAHAKFLRSPYAHAMLSA